jgi:hypothetical protein
MTVFVCYYDYGLDEGFSHPVRAFLTEEEAKNWVKEDGSLDAEYVEIEVG